MYLGVDRSINPTPTPELVVEVVEIWSGDHSYIEGEQLRNQVAPINVHTQYFEHYDLVIIAKKLLPYSCLILFLFLVMLLKFQSDRGWVFGRCFSQGAVPRAGPCKMSGMTKL